MTGQEDNTHLGKTVFVFDDNIVGLFGTNLIQIFNCVFVPTFCDFVEFLCLLLENSSFKNLWRIHCFENSSPVLIPTMFKDMDKQLKLAQGG